MIGRVAFVFAAVVLPMQDATDVAVCPGESDRYSDHKCNHDSTHRVCAQLLGSDGSPLAWGSSGQNFWQITGQEAFQWDSEIRANNGDSWCICMWATARLIGNVGCENVHLHCDSTDVSYVMKAYADGGVDLTPAKECLAKKCPALATQTLSDATLAHARLVTKADVTEAKVGRVAVAAMMAAAVVGLAVAGIVGMRCRAASSRATAAQLQRESESVLE